MYSTFKQNQNLREEFTKQKRIIRSKFSKHLRNTDLEDHSNKRTSEHLTPLLNVFMSSGIKVLYIYVNVSTKKVFFLEPFCVYAQVTDELEFDTKLVKKSGRRVAH